MRSVFEVDPSQLSITDALEALPVPAPAPLAAVHMATEVPATAPAAPAEPDESAGGTDPVSSLERQVPSTDIGQDGTACDRRDPAATAPALLDATAGHDADVLARMTPPRAVRARAVPAVAPPVRAAATTASVCAADGATAHVRPVRPAPCGAGDTAAPSPPEPSPNVRRRRPPRQRDGLLAAIGQHAGRFERRILRMPMAETTAGPTACSRYGLRRPGHVAEPIELGAAHIVGRGTERSRKAQQAVEHERAALSAIFAQLPVTAPEQHEPLPDAIRLAIAHGHLDVRWLTPSAVASLATPLRPVEFPERPWWSTIHLHTWARRCPHVARIRDAGVAVPVVALTVEGHIVGLAGWLDDSPLLQILALVHTADWHSVVVRMGWGRSGPVVGLTTSSQFFSWIRGRAEYPALWSPFTRLRDAQWRREVPNWSARALVQVGRDELTMDEVLSARWLLTPDGGCSDRAWHSAYLPLGHRFDWGTALYHARRQ